MKIIIEGDYKKVKQLFRELKPRCKRDKVYLTIDIPTEVKKNVVKKVKKTYKK